VAGSYLILTMKLSVNLYWHSEMITNANKEILSIC